MINGADCAPLRKLYLSRSLHPAVRDRLEHFYDALTEGGADAALAASLFHYKELEIMQDLKDYLAGSCGVPVTDGRRHSWQRSANDWLPVFQRRIPEAVL